MYRGDVSLRYKFMNHQNIGRVFAIGGGGIIFKERQYSL